MKKVRGIAGVGFLLLVFGFFALMVFMLFAIGMFGKNNLEDSSASTTDTGIVTSGGTDTEFILTHYTPCTPNYPESCDASMEGGSTTAAGGTATYDTSSPMGYVTVYKKKKYYYVVAVSYKREPVLDFVKPGGEPKKGVIFEDPNGVFIALDHFGGDAKSNALDVMASNELYDKFMKNLRKKGFIVGEEQNGISSSPSPKVKGKIVDIINAGVSN